MSGWKLGVVIGVIILCFGMLYPSMFYPMIASLFSRPQPASEHIPNRPPIHPSMNSPRSRPDMHPGMRMAAAQAEAATTSSSKGMFAWMLPLYTVGVVAFLIYTLLKSKKKKHRRRYTYSSDETDSGEESSQEYGAGGLKIGKKKLRSLQERLKQTELAMGKILEQLGTIATEGNQFSPESPTANAVENLVSQDSTSHSTGEKDQYLRDLEKALREFKQLSNSYSKEERKKREEGVNEEDEDEDDNAVNAAGEDELSEDEGEAYHKEIYGNVIGDEGDDIIDRSEVDHNMRKRAKRT